MLNNVKLLAPKQQSVLGLFRPSQVKKAPSNAKAIRNSARGWIHAVAPTPKSSLSIAHPITRIPQLTVSDIMRVNHATIREGQSHRVWPPSVLRTFQTAEVITEKKIQHYELRDVSLTRVG